jgi:hypothetical protein
MSQSFHANLVQFVNRNLFHLAIGQPTSIVNQKRLAVAHALMQMNAWSA